VGGEPEVIYEVEVTRESTRIVVVTATSEDDGGPVPVGSPDLSPEAQRTTIPTPEPEATLEAEETAEPTATPIVGQILVAQQQFQNGNMFWVQPIDQIWIATTNEDGEQIWINRDDTFQEGMPESDPDLDIPAEGLIQPIRGFGKLWREEPEIQDLVGWATDEEFGYTTNYEYHWGGTLDEPAPGYHLIESLNRTVYRFDEATRTWEIIRQPE